MNGTSALSTDVSPLKASNVNNPNAMKNPMVLLCKIDLSRLKRIPTDRNGRLNNGKSPLISGRTSALHFQKRDEDRLSADRNSSNEFAQNGRLSRNRLVDEEKTNRLSSSRDSSTTSSDSSSGSSSSSDNETNNPLENGTSCQSETRYDNDDNPIKHNNSNKTSSGNSSSYNKNVHSNLTDSRNMKYSRSPNIDEKPINKIKRESLKSEFNNCEYNSAYNNSTLKSPKIDDKSFGGKMGYNQSNCRTIDGKNTNIKREQIKMENGIDVSGKLALNDDFAEIDNRKKRPSSANSSPHKEKKRKKMVDDSMMDHQLLPPTNHDRLDSSLLPPPPQKPLVQKVYYSYFDRANEDKDDIG